MTRLETFVDATFAFAITTLVIAGQQAPNSIEALLAAFKNVPAFGGSILVLALFWRGHWLWSRRFGLEDGISILISWTLIFTMLIYVYPLKLVFGAMFYALTNQRVGQPLLVHSWFEARALFTVYALGFMAISLEILLLNWQAWRLREPLRLNERERLLTRSEILGWSVPAGVGLVSLLLALFLPNEQIGWSGWVYYSLALLVPMHRRFRRRQVAQLPG